jgi:hypothetical protein
LRAVARTTSSIKYKILMYDTSDDYVKIFKSITWAYIPCIVVLKHLRPIITIDVGFLLGRYKDRLLMACRYDVENKLLSLAFKSWMKRILIIRVSLCDESIMKWSNLT